MSARSQTHPVIAGLDPAIQNSPCGRHFLDGRVKPGHDQ